MFALVTSVRLLFMVSMASIFASPWAYSAALPVARGAAEDPSTDPFYQPPAGFESTAPGTILRERSIVASFFGLIPDPVEAHQLLYRTTAINGSAIATVTTIFKPPFAKTDRFISFHTAYDSSATICDPSYNYQLGSVQTDLISSVEMFIMEAYLLLGYIVASPDYEGPDAAFSPGHLEGMGVLDGMRAVTNFNETLGLSANPMIIGTGYSGGAIATGWAASLQPSYAPDLDIKGWVQGGTPANLTATMLYIDDTAFSGFLPAAVAGLAKPSAYGAELSSVINSVLTPLGKSKYEFAQSNCAVADLLEFPEMSLLSTSIQTLGAGLIRQPTVASVLNQNIMGLYKNQTPTAPVFIYHAAQDEIIPYADASTLVDSWCSYGASVNFTTYGNGGHVTTEIVGLPDAVQFVEAAFAGEATSGCHRNTELNNTLNPIALGVELEPILSELINALAIAGKNDENIIQNLNVLKNSI
ncbi:uncharacterized protein PFLUO_LOCUS1320 [Penicillium psychrofluorescens]|uniref:uncharacterized protein n=1 Tax=Penicillium psychrofluorescens TaxID=3158075 RepID=UPI003CCD7B9E